MTSIVPDISQTTIHLSSSQAQNSFIMGLIIISAQMKYFPFHPFSVKPANPLSADSVFLHLLNSFVMDLPIVNTNQGNTRLDTP